MNRLNMRRQALAKYAVILSEVYMLARSTDKDLAEMYKDAYLQCFKEYAAVCAIRNAIRKGYRI